MGGCTLNTEENAKYKEKQAEAFPTEPVCKPVMEMSVLTAISRIIFGNLQYG